MFDWNWTVPPVWGNFTVFYRTRNAFWETKMVDFEPRVPFRFWKVPILVEKAVFQSKSLL